MIARLMYLIVVFFQCHALVLSDYYDLQNKGSRVSITAEGRGEQKWHAKNQSITSTLCLLRWTPL